MKKVSGIIIAIIVVFVLGLYSCNDDVGSIVNDPGYQAKKNIELFYAGEFEVLVKMCRKDSGEYLSIKEEAKQIDIMDLALKQKKSKLGLKSVVVIKETITGEGSKATVSVKISYNNGETQFGSIKMIKSEDSWYNLIGN